MPRILASFPRSAAASLWEVPRVFGGLSLPCLESHEAREETLTIQYAYSKDTFFTYVSGGTSL